jgi:RNA polymerase sigma-70 factor (ECF subfamily)
MEPAPQIGPSPLAAELVRHRAPLLAFLCALTRDRDTAEELAQEVGVCVLDLSARGVRPAAFAPWLRGIARHRAADWYRRRARDGAALARFERLADAVEQAFEETWIEAEEVEAQVDALRGCVERLAPRARQLIDARYQDGQPNEEIARRFGWKAAAVKVALAKARRALLDCLGRKRVLG